MTYLLLPLNVLFDLLLGVFMLPFKLFSVAVEMAWGGEGSESSEELNEEI